MVYGPPLAVDCRVLVGLRCCVTSTASNGFAAQACQIVLVLGLRSLIDVDELDMGVAECVERVPERLHFCGRRGTLHCRVEGQRDDHDSTSMLSQLPSPIQSSSPSHVLGA
jgi:hypothetical protein